MKQRYPDWATDKQQEGMKRFLDIAYEYGDFTVSFEKDRHGRGDEYHSFVAVVEWENWQNPGTKKHEFYIAWDYEQTWDCHHQEIHDWQFLFGGGDATREISSEVFFVDLFFYLDKAAKVAA